MKKVPLVLSTVAVMSLVAGASYWAGRTKASGVGSSVEIASSKEKLPEKFRERLEALMDRATKLSASSKVGMNYVDFGAHLQELQGAFDLASVVWPTEELQKEKDDFQNLISSCSLAQALWKEKVKGKHLVLGEADDKDADTALKAAQTLFPGLQGAIVDGGADGMLAIRGSDSNISIMLNAITERVEGLQKLIVPLL